MTITRIILEDEMPKRKFVRLGREGDSYAPEANMEYMVRVSTMGNLTFPYVDDSIVIDNVIHSSGHAEFNQTVKYELGGTILFGPAPKIHHLNSMGDNYIRIEQMLGVLRGAGLEQTGDVLGKFTLGGSELDEICTHFKDYIPRIKLNGTLRFFSDKPLPADPPRSIFTYAVGQAMAGSIDMLRIAQAYKAFADAYADPNLTKLRG